MQGPEWRRLERDLANVSEEMREAVNSTSTAAVYLQSGDDSWRRELESIELEISELETETSPSN